MIRIGNRSFPTKRAAERHVRDILDRHSPGDRLLGEDELFMRALIDAHPSRTMIVDCGIDLIFVQRVYDNLNQPRKRFAVRRTDQSPDVFSWRHAIYPRTAERHLAGILRLLISKELRRFKDEHFRGTCETCHAPITARECQVDHAAPATFERLMAGWLKSLGLTAADIAIVTPKGYDQPSRLEDEMLEQNWLEYHQINARLRCVCRRCNSSTLRTSPEPT